MAATLHRMDLDEFWTLVEDSRAAGGPDTEAVTEHLVAELAAGPDERIFAFYRLQEQLDARAYDWLLWAAAYLIDGGCSDDSFMDFRAGLILQGRETFERALQDPDSLAGLPVVRTLADAYADTDDDTEDEDEDEDVVVAEELFHEAAGSIAPDAYERRHGDDADFWGALTTHAPASPDGSDPTGETFDFDDDAEMHRRLPRLAAMFG